MFGLIMAQRTQRANGWQVILYSGETSYVAGTYSTRRQAILRGRTIRTTARVKVRKA
jgi:hypothetical protein